VFDVEVKIERGRLEVKIRVIGRPGLQGGLRCLSTAPERALMSQGGRFRSDRKNKEMRAEAEALVETVKQSMGLLRRHL
jgi:hypothetical protein